MWLVTIITWSSVLHGSMTGNWTRELLVLLRDQFRGAELMVQQLKQDWFQVGHELCTSTGIAVVGHVYDLYVS